MDSDTDSYHDYVIKDGEFIGAFEEMYRDCPDPWKQDQLQPLREDVALLFLQRTNRDYEHMLDIGCGKGRFLNRLASTITGTSVGIDISPTAVRTAKSRCEGVQFLTADVPPIPFESDTFDLVVTSELLWYVLEDLGPLFSEVERILSSDGHYLLTQKFYDKEEQSYGNDVMETPDDLINKWNFKIIERAHVDGNPAGNHSFVALLSQDPE